MKSFLPILDLLEINSIIFSNSKTTSSTSDVPSKNVASFSVTILSNLNLSYNKSNEGL